MITRMVEASSRFRRTWTVEWVFTISFCGFLLWAVLFLADETYERVIGIGAAVVLVTTRAVQWRRARWEESLRSGHDHP